MKRVILSDLWPPLLGGLVALAAAVLLRTIANTRLLAEVALDAMVSLLPGEDFSSLLGVFGPYGKALFFSSVLFAQIAVYVVVWLRIRRTAGPDADVSRIAVAAGLLSAFVFLIAAIILVSTTEATLGLDTGWPGFAFATLMFSAIYAGVAGVQSMGEQTVATATPESASRRQFLMRVPGFALGGLALLLLARTLRDAAGGGVQVSRRGQPTPPVTPNDEYYLVSKNLIDPQPDGDTWRLNVDGFTQNRLTLTYADMQAMPSQEQYTTMQCISNEVGGELISTALWRGVPLRTVLEQAGMKDGAKYVFFRCADEYTETLPLEYALQDQVLLAYKMNGEPLPKKHGFPLRLLAPGKYGIKHPKWIIEILLLPEERQGYWQLRGWTQDARMKTTVRIDVPGDDPTMPGALLVEGISFSGDRGISRVEVSTDGGATWNDATLKAPLGPYTWVLWDYEWRDVRIGEAVLVARATDGEGVLQQADSTQPFPDGAAAYHRVPVSVVAPT